MTVHTIFHTILRKVSKTTQYTHASKCCKALLDNIRCFTGLDSAVVTNTIIYLYTNSRDAVESRVFSGISRPSTNWLITLLQYSNWNICYLQVVKFITNTVLIISNSNLICWFTSKNSDDHGPGGRNILIVNVHNVITINVISRWRNFLLGL